MKIKLKLAIIGLMAYCSSQSANAQEGSVKVTQRENTNKTVDFSFDKTDPGTYTVIMKFSNLTNTYGQNEQLFTIKGYSGRLTSLTPTNKEQGIGYSYNYSYIKGKLKPKYDPNFLYLLPCKNGSKLFVAESSFVNATYFGNTTPDDWKVYTFFTKEEDTVTAVRKGIVINVIDLYETNSSEGVAFSSRTNEITIEHADGTLATYRGFKKGSTLVKIGQTVFPGNTLGINTKMYNNTRYSISLMVSYLKSADFESTKNKTLATTKSLYGFITPHFQTAEGSDVILIPQKEYTALCNPEIIKKEFSKKELKQEIK
ncbi:hypothetical protein ACFOG5_19695 [Pedobacter fastidiosus]|uniref:Peptidase family M23 n=1 Tax=Pedobacter fastidiosus TaxID=2765361 RepID=A0ABR7KW60_9SPHI|nr:hypothetical protein [Pedobacter fastidiosus]MBC6112307.1 hypothetical protein [Pedobacter fastidiosus]